MTKVRLPSILVMSANSTFDLILKQLQRGCSNHTPFQKIIFLLKISFKSSICLGSKAFQLFCTLHEFSEKKPTSKKIAQISEKQLLQFFQSVRFKTKKMINGRKFDSELKTDAKNQFPKVLLLFLCLPIICQCSFFNFSFLFRDVVKNLKLLVQCNF